MTRHSVMQSLAVLLACIVFQSAHADIPKSISYQGKVTDTGGNPVADGSYIVRFRIYDAESGGNLEWDSGDRPVDISDGVFTVLLGESPQPALDLSFDQDYWLEVSIEGDVQTPRVRLGSVGYSYMASGVVPGTEVLGSVTTGTYAAFKATNSSESFLSYGVYGGAASTEGRGVAGYASSSSGTTYGVFGLSVSPGGRGVHGEVWGASGSNRGVSGVTYSTSGTAVYGEALAATGVTSGVYGLTSSTSGYGVFGKATATTGFAYGGYFQSAASNGRGVFGWVTATTGPTVAGQFWSASPSGIGVQGYASATTGSTYGVVGGSASPTGMGLYGEVYTTTGLNYGVYGKTPSVEGRGVAGVADAPTGDTYGGYFSSLSPDGIGVYGEALATNGVWECGVMGKSASTLGAGVVGEGGHGGRFTGTISGVLGETYSTSSLSHGVFGRAGATTGDATGVLGESWPAQGSGIGVYGRTWSTDGTGVYYSGGLAGTGSKSCVVKTSQGPTMFYCQESPESWFEDFGEGQLVNGIANIELDAIFLETVAVDEANPMHVFLQPYDSGCVGLVVKRRAAGFMAVNPADPNASGMFSYRVVAKRRGFESRRLDICEAARTDPYLYPELRDQDDNEEESHEGGKASSRRPLASIE